MKTQSILGKISAGTHEASFGVAYLVLRFLMGGLFFFSGLVKVTTDWSAESYLLAANGPFADWFHTLAGNGMVDAFNAWGVICIGLAILFGFLVRPAALLGIVLMILYYLAHFALNTADGYINEQTVYAAVLFLFLAGGAGHAYGLNAIILGNLRKPSAVTRFLFG
ncbi:MAG: DoxX family protein [Patescibacteria group bacterium]|jgi:thiosulfate dehydrogenase [quinone] large subunit